RMDIGEHQADGVLAGKLAAGAVAAAQRRRRIDEIDGHLIGPFGAALAFAEQPGAVGGDAELGDLLAQAATRLQGRVVGSNLLNQLLGQCWCGHDGSPLYSAGRRDVAWMYITPTMPR